MVEGGETRRARIGAKDTKASLVFRDFHFLHRSKGRVLTVVSLLIVVPLGFYTKFYAGPAANWVNNSLAGTFYEIFWCLLISLFLDKGRPWAIAAGVLVVTCGLEFLQLWHPPALTFVRSYFIGRAVLGTSFAWSDFPYYFLGCGIGWLWMRWLRAMHKHSNSLEG
jgi:hypothetical protein